VWREGYLPGKRAVAMLDSAGQCLRVESSAFEQ
jgi:hypothetical protein